MVVGFLWFQWKPCWLIFSSRSNRVLCTLFLVIPTFLMVWDMFCALWIFCIESFLISHLILLLK